MLQSSGLRGLGIAGLFLSLLIFGSNLGEAARVRELGLADMVARAGQIFVGECAQRTVLTDPTGRPYTEYVFDVLRPIKGVDGPTVVFTVAVTPDGRGFAGLPVFEPGERALLLLYPAVPGGRSAPMGLDQGHFRLVAGPDGAPRVVNGQGNRRLFKDVPRKVLDDHGLTRRTGGPIRLERMEGLIEALLEAGQP